MILTGPEIARQVAQGRIIIDPFDPLRVSPNSYDFTLGDTIVGYEDEVLDVARENQTWERTLDDEGFVLWPGRIYLGHTLEVMGSEHYVPIIRARSSTARLGLFIHVTADLIDIGSVNQWTLQLFAVQPLRIYPRMAIGQVTFWQPVGEIELYEGKYQGSRGPTASKSFAEFEVARRAGVIA
jgi:dCTP deaminase